MQFLYNPFNNPISCWELFRSLNQTGSPADIRQAALAFNAGVTKEITLEDTFLNFLNVGLFLYKQGKLTEKDFELIWMPCIYLGIDVRIGENFYAGSTWASTLILDEFAKLILDNPWMNSKEFPDAAIFLFNSFMRADLSRFGLISAWEDMLWSASEGDGTVDERLVKFCQFFERYYGAFPELRRSPDSDAVPLKVTPSAFHQNPPLSSPPSCITAPEKYLGLVQEIIGEFYGHRRISELPANQLADSLDSHTFKQRLQAMWQDLQNASRGLLPYGYDSVWLDIPQIQAAGIGEFKLFPSGEAPNAQARFMSVRAYDSFSTTVWDHYDFQIDNPRMAETLQRPRISCVDLAMLIAVHSMWLLLVSQTQQQKTQARIQQPLTRVPLEHLQRIIRPMFKRLPEGKHRTERAEIRSVESGKGIPPEGKTFARTDFDPKTKKPVPARSYKYVRAEKAISETMLQAQPMEHPARFTYTTELLSF